MNEDRGQAGASARREYERRRARDEKRIRDDWGRLGGLVVALTPERQSTRAWSIGASGEDRVGRELDRVASDRVRVLHDRRIPRSRANIDHLAVTADGVWVVDAKKYRGRPALRIEGGFLRPRVEKLLIGGRDKTVLVDGVSRQVELVRDVVPNIPVRGVLCFVEADWPLLGGGFEVRDIAVLWPRELTSRLARAARAGVDVADVTARLAEHFRSA